MKQSIVSSVSWVYPAVWFLHFHTRLLTFLGLLLSIWSYTPTPLRLTPSHQGIFPLSYNNKENEAMVWVFVPNSPYFHTLGKKKRVADIGSNSCMVGSEQKLPVIIYRKTTPRVSILSPWLGYNYDWIRCIFGEHHCIFPGTFADFPTKLLSFYLNFLCSHLPIIISQLPFLCRVLRYVNNKNLLIAIHGTKHQHEIL